MESLKPPKPLSLHENVQEQWKKWKQNFEFYLIATEYKMKSEEVRAGLFLHSAGEAARDVYNSLTFDQEGDSLKYSKILEKFEAYVNPRKNITFCRYKFFTHTQADSQSFDSYLTEMRNLCNAC